MIGWLGGRAGWVDVGVGVRVKLEKFVVPSEHPYSNW